MIVDKFVFISSKGSYLLSISLLIGILGQPPLIAQETGSKSGTWSLIECEGEPEGRHETTFVEWQGKFYLIGGRESRNIDCFDPESNSWSKMNATSPLIHHFQPVVLGDKIYMAGAMTDHYQRSLQ